MYNNILVAKIKIISEIIIISILNLNLYPKDIKINPNKKKNISFIGI